MPPVLALCLASRIAPLARGEDAEASSALCRALARAGERVVVVTRRPPAPSDDDLDRAGMARRLDPLEVSGPHGTARFSVREGRAAGGTATVFALEGAAIGDDHLLAAAALELAASRGLWPDLVRAWQSVPNLVARAEEIAPPPGRSRPASVLLLSDVSAAGLSPALRGALAAARRVALPSTSYVEDLLQSGEGELVELLRAAPEKVRGIPPGIDEAHWNPAHDPHLPPQQQPKSGAARLDKSGIKRELRRDLGLVSSGAPLACVLGPSDLLDRDSSEALAHAGAQLVFAHDRATLPGSERHALELAHHHPTRVRTVTADPPLLHRLVAAADLALFCHRYTPGGFSPLYCMPYGTVPVTPRAGAFADAVVDYDQATGTGTGFLYAPHRPEDIPAAARRAVRAAASGEAWTELALRVAHTDLSWRTAGLRHAELGREALRAR